MRAAAAAALTAAFAAAAPDVSFYVLSTARDRRVNKTHADELHWIRSRAVPALDTWGAHFSDIYFVVESDFATSPVGARCVRDDAVLRCPALHANASFLPANCTDEHAPARATTEVPGGTPRGPSAGAGLPDGPRGGPSRHRRGCRVDGPWSRPMGGSR